MLNFIDMMSSDVTRDGLISLTECHLSYTPFICKCIHLHSPVSRGVGLFRMLPSRALPLLPTDFAIKELSSLCMMIFKMQLFFYLIFSPLSNLSKPLSIISINSLRTEFTNMFCSLSSNNCT